MKTFYFVVKSDHHIVEPGCTLLGNNTKSSADEMLAMIAEETVELSVVLDLGDIADTAVNPDRQHAAASEAAYQNAAISFARIKAPQLYLPGNHDEPSLLYSILGNNWTRVQDGCYEYPLGDITLIGIDCRTGPEATGYLSAATATALTDALKRTKKAILFTHYPWVSLNNSWIEREGMILNGEKLQAVLSEYRPKLLAAFHGHLHSWCSYVNQGIPVFCSAGSALAFALNPEDGEISTVINGTLGYLLVSISEDDTVVVRARHLPSKQFH